MAERTGCDSRMGWSPCHQYVICWSKSAVQWLHVGSNQAGEVEPAAGEHLMGLAAPGKSLMSAKTC